LVQHEFGAPTRHEHTRFDSNPQPAEFGPPEDLLEWNSAHPSPHHLFEFVWRCRRRQQKLGLVLGEHAAGNP
jgi:hypothetical protein